LAEENLYPGSAGLRIRNITACQGNNVCRNGLINTIELAEKIEKRCNSIEQNLKFKVGITGCNNNCLTAEQNDIGIKGIINPKWNKDNCTLCQLCKNICPTGALKVDKAEGKVEIDKSACTLCGKCVKACPFNSLDGEIGYQLYFGGNFANRITIGQRISGTIYEHEKIIEIIDKTFEFYNKYAKDKERFSYTLERVGLESLQEYLIEKVDLADVACTSEN